MDINIIQKKINKYRKKLRKSQSLEKSDFYQSKLGYYHKLKQSGGIIPEYKEKVEKVEKILDTSYKTIADSIGISARLIKDLKEKLDSKQQELDSLKTEYESKPDVDEQLKLLITKTEDEKKVLEEQLKAFESKLSEAGETCVSEKKELEGQLETLKGKLAETGEAGETCVSNNKELNDKLGELTKQIKDQDDAMTDTLAFLGVFSEKMKSLSEEMGGKSGNGNGNGNGDGGEEEVIIAIEPEEGPLTVVQVQDGGGCGCGGTGGRGCGCGCGRLPTLPLSTRK